jgi:hypothetical protein
MTKSADGLRLARLRVAQLMERVGNKDDDYAKGWRAALEEIEYRLKWDLHHVEHTDRPPPPRRRPTSV